MEFPNYKSQTKAVLRSVGLQNDPRCTIEAGTFNFQYAGPSCIPVRYSFTMLPSYMIDQGVCYLCITDRLFPKRLAFNYLDEIASSFYEQYGTQVEGAQRPYAFIQFGKQATLACASRSLMPGFSSVVDTALQRIKRNYKDSRNQQNLSRLNDEIQNVTKIMTKNIQDVVQRGEKIDKLSFISSHLVGESKKYARETRMLNLRALYRKYFFPLVGFLLMVALLYFYYCY